jgi:hypothetical protein
MTTLSPLTTLATVASMMPLRNQYFNPPPLQQQIEPRSFASRAIDIFVDNCAQCMNETSREICMYCCDDLSEHTFARNAQCWYYQVHDRWNFCAILPICAECYVKHGCKIDTPIVSFRSKICDLIVSHSTPLMFPIICAPDNIELLAFRCLTNIIIANVNDMNFDDSNPVDHAISGAMKMARNEWAKCNGVHNIPHTICSYLLKDIRGEHFQHYIARTALIDARIICESFASHIALDTLRICFRHMLLVSMLPIVFECATIHENAFDICGVVRIMMYP